MRNTFIDSLVKIAESNKNICFMTGDLGYGAVEPFMEKYPNRFINAGIAEQNMAGMAAGLAMAGKHVFTYSIGNFPTFRCAEQLRNDVDYHELSVTTVSIGGGLAYGALGYSHHTIQDYGLIRMFPNTLILSPCDPNEVVGCVEYITENPQSSYLRLGKTGERNFSTKQKLHPGMVNLIVSSNSDKALITTGAALQSVGDETINGNDIYTVPIWGEKVSVKQIEDLISEYSIVTVLEDHIKACGLYSWICEKLENKHLLAKLRSLSISSDVIGEVGSQRYLQKKYLKLS